MSVEVGDEDFVCPGKHVPRAHGVGDTIAETLLNVLIEIIRIWITLTIRSH